jgi:hypothetical protein
VGAFGEHGYESLDFIMGGEFFDQLIDCHLLNDSVS